MLCTNCPMLSKAALLTASPPRISPLPASGNHTPIRRIFRFPRLTHAPAPAKIAPARIRAHPVMDWRISAARRAKRLPSTIYASSLVVTVEKEVAEVRRVRLPLICAEIRPGLNGGKKIISSTSTARMRRIHRETRSGFVWSGKALRSLFSAIRQPHFNRNKGRRRFRRISAAAVITT